MEKRVCARQFICAPGLSQSSLMVPGPINRPCFVSLCSILVFKHPPAPFSGFNCCKHLFALSRNGAENALAVAKLESLSLWRYISLARVMALPLTISRYMAAGWQLIHFQMQVKMKLLAPRWQLFTAGSN